MTSKSSGSYGRASGLYALIALTAFTASIWGCSTPTPLAVECPKPVQAPASLCSATQATDLTLRYEEAWKRFMENFSRSLEAARTP